MDIFIDIALSIDRTIYTWIPYVYNLIVKLAGYEVFSPEQINGLSRRVYALLGIFMLFKLSFSMISYVVNPDEFSDKTKGFGGLIKNVIISMVLIVAVPYIFIEAYNVQKMILEDGTIIKLVLPVAGANDEENSDRSSIAYANRGAGEEISFILFTQFAKPNDVIVSIKDSCRRLYALDDSGNRIHTTNSEYAYALDNECDEVLKGLFENSTENKSGAYQYYKDAMEYENYNILVNHPEIFRAEVPADMYVSASAGKSVKSNVKVIKYNWILSFIIGIVVLLFLITLCVDVATRTIKLAFYQIIAPIPIISHCDPKAKKDGMFNKWVKACFATYLDLFIRLFVFFLAIFIIRSFSQKLYANSSDAAVIVFIIIAALAFAKQAPKIVEDLTGLKIEKFTLNPFKKVANEALLPEKVGKTLGKIGLAGAVGLGFGAGKALAMKTVAGIDAKRNDKGFFNGFNSVHGKLGTSIDKIKQNWTPYSYSEAKSIKEAKERGRLDAKREEKGKQFYDAGKMDEAKLKGKLRKLSPEYEEMFEDVNKKKVSMYKAQARNKAWSSAILDKSNPISKANRDLITAALGLNSDVGDDEILRMLDKNSNTWQKQYDEAKRQLERLGKESRNNRKAAELQAAFDYYKDTYENLATLPNFDQNYNPDGESSSGSTSSGGTSGGSSGGGSSSGGTSGGSSGGGSSSGGSSSGSTSGGGTSGGSSGGGSPSGGSSSGSTSGGGTSGGDSSADKKYEEALRKQTELVNERIKLDEKKAGIMDELEIIKNKLINASSYDRDRLLKEEAKYNDQLNEINKRLLEIEIELRNLSSK